MRHQKKRLKFNRSVSNRDALKRALITSLLLHGRIKTTQNRAEKIRPIVEKLITAAKSREKRLAIELAKSVVYEAAAGQKLVNELTERYKDRPGGYTRIVKLGFRAGDSAPMAEIQLV